MSEWYFLKVLIANEKSGLSADMSHAFKGPWEFGATAMIAGSNIAGRT